MICKKELIDERKRLPKLLKKALKEGDSSQVVELVYLIDCIDWILDENCECKS